MPFVHKNSTTFKLFNFHLPLVEIMLYINFSSKSFKAKLSFLSPLLYKCHKSLRTRTYIFSIRETKANGSTDLRFQFSPN